MLQITPRRVTLICYSQVCCGVCLLSSYLTRFLAAKQKVEKRVSKSFRTYFERSRNTVVGRLDCWLDGPGFESRLEQEIFLLSETPRPALVSNQPPCSEYWSCSRSINPYPTAFPYGNGMVLHFYQQQESSTTKTVHKVINKGLKTYV